LSKGLIWVDANGAPSSYIIDASLHAATVLDQMGSRRDDATASYWNHAIGGSYSPRDLRVGERLLVDCGLVIEKDESLFPTETLLNLLGGTVDDARAFVLMHALRRLQPTLPVLSNSSVVDAVVSDPSRREEILLALGQRFDDQYRKMLGDVGERIVLEQVRSELAELGYEQLARATRRVSLLSDQLGYDISAPRIAGANRLLEVKSTTKALSERISIFVTRNEINTSLKVGDWFLVVCKIDNIDGALGNVVGWCIGNDLIDLLPRDAPLGSWEEARIELPTNRLTPGLPRP
jgi:hypothetical protein